MEIGEYYISCQFKNCDDNFIWVFSGTYGPISNSGREALWSDIGDIRGLWNDPWCISRDFNVVRLPKERRNCLRMSLAMRRFSEVIDKLQLRDLPLTGGSFTWCGRFLVSEDWESHFCGLFQCLLPKPTSDHAPILLDGGGITGRKTPLHSENMWLKVEGFTDLSGIGGWAIISGDPAVIFLLVN